MSFLTVRKVRFREGNLSDGPLLRSQSMEYAELTVRTSWKSHSGLRASSKSKEPSRWWMVSLACPPWRSFLPVGVSKPSAPPTGSEPSWKFSEQKTPDPAVSPQRLFPQVLVISQYLRGQTPPFPSWRALESSYFSVFRGRAHPVLWCHRRH